LPRRLKRWFLNQNKSLKRLYNTISVDDVLQLKGNKFYVGEKEITKEVLINLQQEAKFLKETYLWEILTNQIKYLSNERMYSKSKSDDDIVFGKATLYNLQIQEDIIKLILNKKIE